jgi:hypothetical protein
MAGIYSNLRALQAPCLNRGPASQAALRLAMERGSILRPLELPSPRQMRALIQAAGSSVAARGFRELSAPMAESSELLEDPTRSPNHDDQVAYVLSRVQDTRARAAFTDLERREQSAVYLLLLSHVERDRLLDLLRRNSSNLYDVLDAVLSCYDAEVHGYQRGLQPTPGDLKFLGRPGRVASLLAEYRQGLWYACNVEGILSVELDKRCSIGWHLLESNAEAMAHLRSELVPHLDRADSDYRRQSHMNVDVVVQNVTGQWAVEVKRSSAIFGTEGPDWEVKTLLQAFRLAAVVLAGHYRGIEYVVEAAAVRGRFIERLRVVLNSTGLPYLIRFEGSQRQSIEGGLEYRVRPGRVALPAPRVLPPVPEDKEERGQREVPWDEGMAAWFGELCGPLDLRRVHVARDAYRHIRTLSVDDQAVLVKAVRECVAELPEIEMGRRARILSARLHQRRVSWSDFQLMIEIAQILAQLGAQVEDESIDEIPIEDHDHPAIQAIVRSWFAHARDTLLPKVSGEWERFRVDVEAAATDRPQADLVESLTILIDDADALVAYLSQPLWYGELGIRALLRRAEEAFASGVVAEIHDALTHVEEMRAAIVAAHAQMLATLEHVSVTDIFEPIPDEIVESLQEQVLALGRAPVRAHSPGVTSAGAGTLPRVRAFSQERIDRIFNRLLLYREIGDSVYYYYDAERELIWEDARCYLTRTEIPETQHEEHLEQAWERWRQSHEGGQVGGVASLEDLIGEEFVRSDLADIYHPLTGDRIDVKEMIGYRLLSQDNLDLSSNTDVIRVVVIRRGGRVRDTQRVYFIQPNLFEERFAYSIMSMVTFDQLKSIFGDVALRDRFLPALGASLEAHTEEGAQMTLRSSQRRRDRIDSCQVTEGSFNPQLSGSYLQVTWERRGDRLHPVDAHGWGGFDLFQAWTEGCLGRCLSSIERWVLSNTINSGVKNIKVSDYSELLDLMCDPLNLKRLLELMAFLDEETDWMSTAWRIVAQTGGATLQGLKILPGKLEKLRGHDGQFEFMNYKAGDEDEAQCILVAVSGPRTVGIVLKYIEHRIGRALTHLESHMLGRYYGGNSVTALRLHHPELNITPSEIESFVTDPSQRAVFQASLKILRPDLDWRQGWTTSGTLENGELRSCAVSHGMSSAAGGSRYKLSWKEFQINEGEEGRSVIALHQASGSYSVELAGRHLQSLRQAVPLTVVERRAYAGALSIRRKALQDTLDLGQIVRTVLDDAVLRQLQGLMVCAFPHQDWRDWSLKVEFNDKKGVSPVGGYPPITGMKVAGGLIKAGGMLLYWRPVPEREGSFYLHTAKGLHVSAVERSWLEARLKRKIEPFELQLAGALWSTGGVKRTAWADFEAQMIGELQLRGLLLMLQTIRPESDWDAGFTLQFLRIKGEVSSPKVFAGNTVKPMRANKIQVYVGFDDDHLRPLETNSPGIGGPLIEGWSAA